METFLNKSASITSLNENTLTRIDLVNSRNVSFYNEEYEALLKMYGPNAKLRSHKNTSQIDTETKYDSGGFGVRKSTMNSQLFNKRVKMFCQGNNPSTKFHLSIKRSEKLSASNSEFRSRSSSKIENSVAKPNSVVMSKRTKSKEN